MDRNPKRFQSLVLLGTLFLLPFSSASARHHPVELPIDSPAWWTLTDEISPVELRQTHLDREDNLKRYLTSLRAGQTRRLSVQEAEKLIFFVDGTVDPELVPLWLTFTSLATVRTLIPLLGPADNYRPDDEWLAYFGVSEEGVQQVLDVAAHHRNLYGEMEEELTPLWEEYEELRRRAVKALGGDEKAEQKVQDATYAGDARYLATLGRETLEKTMQLLEAMNADMLLELSMKTLPKLRQRLGDDDWNAMRRFFLNRIAPSFGSATGFEGGR